MNSEKMIYYKKSQKEDIKMGLKKRIRNSSMNLLSVCALALTLFSSKNLCFWIMYQEELPESVKRKLGK